MLILDYILQISYDWIAEEVRARFCSICPPASDFAGEFEVIPIISNFAGET